MQPPLMLAWMSSEPCSEAARATTFGTAPNIAHASAVFRCFSPKIDLDAGIAVGSDVLPVAFFVEY